MTHTLRNYLILTAFVIFMGSIVTPVLVRRNMAALAEEAAPTVVAPAPDSTDSTELRERIERAIFDRAVENIERRERAEGPLADIIERRAQEAR